MHMHIAVPVIAVLIAVAFSCTSVWIRRSTWQSQWENLTTLQVLLQGVALLLLSNPAAQTLGTWLHSLTGIWHLNSLIGQCIYIVTAATILAAVLRRIATDDQAAEAAALYINPVVTLAIPIACCAFLLSNSMRGSFYANVFRMPCDFWLNMYWTILGGTITYLLGYAIRAFHVARRDPRHRRACDMRIVAMCFAIAGCAVVVLTGWFPALDALDPRGLTIWWCCCACAVIFSLSTACSWRTAMEPVRAFRKATRPERTRPRVNQEAPPL